MKNRKHFLQNFQTKKGSEINLKQSSRKQIKDHLQSLDNKILNSVYKNVKLPSVRFSKIFSNQKYILNQIIGEGAFAKVRLGYRKSDSLPCVIKSYQKFRMSSQQKKKSVRKQISILQKIDHSKIIKIIDYYQNMDTINIVMESFSTHSLAIYTKENRPLQQQTIKNITKSIAEALVYLHENKISHRDLKPQNILINSQQQIKIIDLGLSMMGDHDQMIVAGTPQFMCPELLNKKKYDPFKADIWALGILLYWISLGYYPQDNNKKLKMSKQNNSFQLKFPVDIHPGLQYLIQKMLQIDPILRISAKDILQDSWIKPRNIKFQLQRLAKMSKK